VPEAYANFTVGPVAQKAPAPVLYKLFTPTMLAWPPEAGVAAIPIATKSAAQLGVPAMSNVYLAGVLWPPPGAGWKLKLPVPVNCVP